MITINFLNRFFRFPKKNKNAKAKKKESTKKAPAIQKVDLNDLMKNLKERYEKSSKKASTTPILDECVRFYNDNFDPKERAIGVTFIGQKVIPRAVPLIKQAINDIVIEQDLDINEILNEQNFEMLLEYEVEPRGYFT